MKEKTLTEDQKYFYLKSLDYRIWDWEMHLRVGHIHNREETLDEFCFDTEFNCPMCEAYGFEVNDKPKGYMTHCTDCPARNLWNNGDGYCKYYNSDKFHTKEAKLILKGIKRKRQRIAKMEVT